MDASCLEEDLSSILQSEESSFEDECCTFSGAVTVDGDEIVESDEADLVCKHVLDENLETPEDWPAFKKPETVTEKFRDQIVVGDVWSAASVLVKQAAFQTNLVPEEVLSALFLASCFFSAWQGW